MPKTFRLADIWANVRRRQQALSAGFDAAIDGLLLAFLTALSNSSLRRYRTVERAFNALTSTHDRIDSDPEIVTQGASHTQKATVVSVSPRLTRFVSRASLAGFLGLLLMAAWWTWPSPQGSSAQSMADTTPAAVATPLGIVNPANMAGLRATATLTPTLRMRAQPAFVSMPGLAGRDDEVDPTALPSPTSPPVADVASSLVADVENPAAELALPAVLSVDAEIQADETPSVATASEIVVIAAAPQGALEAYLIPTPAGTPTPTPDVPFVEIIAVPGFTLPDGIETATPTPSPTPTPVPIALVPGRLWSNFTPKPASESTHFWIARPFPESVGNKIASPNYQFGSTAGGRYRIHHGMDISNPMGTPVRAATAGEVVHAGWDDPELLGPYGGFYGNSVVIRLDRRLPVAGGELDVYLLYGHLSEVTTTVGARVGIDDIVGRVGMTGIAIGPHLHVEVRIGANSYENSVNPYLWVEPHDNGGAVAVRLLSADGRTWPDARLSLARFQGSKAVWARQIEIYPGAENLGPDPAWGENGAMGSVPPGRYYIIGRVNGETIRTEIDVIAGETTFVELRTEQ